MSNNEVYSESGRGLPKHAFANLGAIPSSADAKLDRKALASALTAAGFPITYSTLATKATRGGGPPFSVWGRKPLYRWGDALAWAQSRLGAAACTTSEHRAA